MSAKGGGGGRTDGKKGNTIIQQIKGITMTPMNDLMAEQTIEDHKYLLEQVENKAAIAYFAAANRNMSLFNALMNYVIQEIEREDDLSEEDHTKEKEKDSRTDISKKEQVNLDKIFRRMILDYDFMSVVMYPELRKRREFVHDAWIIAKTTENLELKVAIADDPYFYLKRTDILTLLKTEDDHMIHHVLLHEINLYIDEDVSYKLVKIKGAQVNLDQQTTV
jgi:hypothetical protein